MNLNDYEKFVDDINLTINTDRNLSHCKNGLVEEVGEYHALFKRIDRGDKQTNLQNKIEAELGDILYYVVALIHEHGRGVEDIMRGNYFKLRGRQQRGTLLGEGDDR